MKLTASMIVRNELGRYLEPCVAHLLEFCDEVRILDDGSTDGWRESLREAWGADGRRVVTTRHQVERRNYEPDFHLHAAARNALLEFTLAGWPDYVLAIDADEFVSDGAAVRRACEHGGDVLGLEIAEVWEARDKLLYVREDGGWRPHQIGCVWRAARFRNAQPALADKGHATGRVPDAVHRVNMTPTGATLLHFGWANTGERAERYARYAEGDAGKYHARAHIESIMWPARRVRLSRRAWPAGLSAETRAAVVERANRVEVGVP